MMPTPAAPCARCGHAKEAHYDTPTKMSDAPACFACFRDDGISWEDMNHAYVPPTPKGGA